MSKIVTVAAKDDHTLEIGLNNCHKVIYDMKPRLNTVRFRPLQPLYQFKTVRVEHGDTLVWEGLCEITLDEIISTLER